MSPLVKGLVVGIGIGLVIGLVFGYALTGALRLQNRIDELGGQVTNLQTQINNLQSQISEKDNQVSNLQSQISNKDAQISTLQTQIETRNTEITSLQAQVSEKESEITYLQSRIDELEALVPPYTKGEWNLLKTFSGSTERTTELFIIPSSEIKIGWDLKPGSYASFSIWLYDEQGKYVEAWLHLQEQLQGETYAHALSTGNYYLELSVYDVQYTVVVEAWIPE